MSHQVMTANPSGLDLKSEIEWGELMLASQDMANVQRIISLFKVDPTRERTIVYLTAIVSTYCRPFKKNNRDRVVGNPFLSELSAEGRAAHDKVVGLRDADHAHSDFYHGRVHVRSDGASIYVREGIEPDSAAPDDVQVRVKHTQRTSMRVPSVADIDVLRENAIVLREAFKRRGREVSTPILAARITSGYLGWFELGREKVTDKQNPPGGVDPLGP